MPGMAPSVKIIRNFYNIFFTKFEVFAASWFGERVQEKEWSTARLTVHLHDAGSGKEWSRLELLHMKYSFFFPASSSSSLSDSAVSSLSSVLYTAKERSVGKMRVHK